MADVTNPDGEAAPEVTADSAEDFEAFETEANDDVVDEEESEVDTDTPDTPEPADEDEEIEHEGKKYRIPKPLKDGFLMQADYTRKTQALAQDKQALEAERSQFRQLSQAEIGAHAAIVSIDTALAEYQQIDWRAWAQQDPAAAQAARFEMDDLRDRRQTALSEFGQVQQQRQMQEQQETARRMQEGAARLAKEIPGWNQDKANALLEFGQKQYGFSPQEMGAIDDPRMVVVLNEALQYRELTTKNKQRERVEAVQAVTPVPTLRGNSGRTGVKPSTTDFAAFERMANKR